MPQQITTAFSKLLAAIREFSVAQRTIAVIGLALLVVAAIAVTSWVSKPQMRALYTNLAPADASAIVDQLTSNGVAYELTNGGATIMVPADQVYDQRLKVASSGLTPVSESGYSLLDNMGLTASTFQQNVTYKRALEGELSATVSSMAGVETATVQLALPEESVFVSESPDPTASVFVKAKGGTAFSDDQVQAMIQFVASSVPGMKSTDVSVVDASGAVLSAQGAEKSAASSKETAEYETRVSKNIQGMLDRIVGNGMAVVSVTAELDYDATERTSEKFTSNKDAQPLTERESTEEYVGTGNNATGVLGPDNIAVPNGENGGNYTNSTTERNNAVDKVTEHTVTAPGTVKKQSISVAVDDAAAAAINMQDLQAMVASAAGIDEERGDVVTVTRMAFDKSAADAAQQALQAAEEQEAAAAQRLLIRDAAIAAALLIAAIIVVVALRRRKRKAQQFEDLEPLDLGEVMLTREENRINPAALLDEIDMPVLPELPSDADQAAQVTERKRQDVGVLADENPAQIANHLRELMEVKGS
ncbi:flagellar basal-body MS-ring/collar protein FliF [Timonella sp. A28]|uniref:flagellar basal-body MS-ring/collar protein FliF n=1 Tax=Timonella sp. A28 TaxID=3442640 RepID=UPI003EBC984A